MYVRMYACARAYARVCRHIQHTYIHTYICMRIFLDSLARGSSVWENLKNDEVDDSLETKIVNTWEQLYHILAFDYLMISLEANFWWSRDIYILQSCLLSPIYGIILPYFDSCNKFTVFLIFDSSYKCVFLTLLETFLLFFIKYCILTCFWFLIRYRDKEICRLTLGRRLIITQTINKYKM